MFHALLKEIQIDIDFGVRSSISGKVNTNINFAGNDAQCIFCVHFIDFECQMQYRTKGLIEMKQIMFVSEQAN